MSRTSVPRREVRYTLATLEDDTAIRRLLRDNPMRGAISLSFEREPDYFRGTQLAGAEDRTILAFERDRLVCMGRCSMRPCWLNGEIRRIAHLGELRLDSSAHGRFDLLHGGYEFFRTLSGEAPVDFTFTSIASDNFRARALLERGLRGMPRYEFLTEFVTLLIPTARPGSGATLALESAGVAELAAFFNTEASRHHLATAWTEERLASLGRHGLPPERFAVHREAGRIVAAAALWDQRPFRQTVIRNYAHPLSFNRPLLNLAARLTGRPQLPDPGTVLAHAFLSPLAIASGRESLLSGLVEALRRRAAAQGLDFITLGFSTNDPRLGLLRARFRTRAYASRVYRVTWAGDPPVIPLDNRPFLPEVALL